MDAIPDTGSHISEGVEGFDPDEQAYCEKITKLAKDVSMEYQGWESVHKLADVANEVIKAKGNDTVVTTRVYFFCLSWLAGAMSVAESGEYVKRKSLTMTHCALAFIAGAAIITIYEWM
jgi:hypothetical protein